MKIQYEEGDKVVVKETGVWARVKRVVVNSTTTQTLVLDNGDTPFADQVRPAIDVGLLMGEGQTSRVFLGMPGTLAEEPHRDAMELAQHYNQALEMEDKSNFEVIWVETVDELEAAIREANGDEVPETVTCNDGTVVKVGDPVWWEDPDEGKCSGNRKIAKIKSEDEVVLTDETGDDETECDPGEELSVAQLDCDQCGKPMFVQEDGVAHHLDVDRAEVDHDADADHVPLNKLLA